MLFSALACISNTCSAVSCSFDAELKDRSLLKSRQLKGLEGEDAISREDGNCFPSCYNIVVINYNMSKQQVSYSDNFLRLFQIPLVL